jgi:GT2 family glycosyltransferase
VLKWYKDIVEKRDNIKVINWPEQPFSYARSCNYGAEKSTGEYLIMLNNDTEVITPNWIELLMSDAQREGIGAVGCKLYFPGGKLIQHAGIGLGLGGYAANLLSMVPNKRMSPLQHLYGDTRHEVSAVTAACMMIKKDRFNKVNGFDEKFRITYNDVDLCLRLQKEGYRNIYNPAIELIHHESISVGLPKNKKLRDNKEFIEAQRLFVERWQKIIEYDPHLNPNISRDNALIEVKTSF